MSDELKFNHFHTKKIAINIFQGRQHMNLIKFLIQIQIVMFRRGHPGTPIDPAPVLLSGILCSTSHLNVDPQKVEQFKVDRQHW